ncbi:MAG: hypothetical protein ACOX6N_03570 [Patescibacteria group bacterium]|jgi:hypothetical protein
MTILVVGIFDDFNSVHNAISGLFDIGYQKQLTVVGREVDNYEATQRLDEELLTTNAVEKPYYGALFSSISDEVTNIKFIDFQELGKVIFGGVLADTLVSLLPMENNHPKLIAESLSSIGIPSEKVEFYYENLLKGLALIMVTTRPGKESEIVEILKEYGALHTDATTVNVDIKPGI